MSNIQDLLDSYRAAPIIYAGILHDVGDEQARTAHGGDENWSVTEILCHLHDADEISLKRVRLMRDQDHPFLAAYDQEQLARERNYTAQHWRDAFESFKQIRAQYVAELSALTAEQWQRSGQHEEVGRVTIEGSVAHMAAHDMIHAAQIARQLGRA
jgi:uncharacterized damage-inducible protein DinB